VRASSEALFISVVLCVAPCPCKSPAPALTSKPIHTHETMAHREGNSVKGKKPKGYLEKCNKDMGLQLEARGDSEEWEGAKGTGIMGGGMRDLPPQCVGKKRMKRQARRAGMGLLEGEWGLRFEREQQA